jgi:hypothetical protein
MKNLSKFLIAIVVLCCFETACNKQEDLIMPGSENINLLKSGSIKHGTVFTVSPSADLKDSYSIQKAFNDAVAAGPGSTVQLTAGTFYLDERIEVEGFVGSFKGAGKEKTIITTPPDQPVDFSLPDADFESLIKFRHGNINVSDFTVNISNPNPCTGVDPFYNGGFPSVFSFTGNSVKERPTTDQAICFTLNNLKLIGLNYTDDAGSHYNIYCGINHAWDGYVSEDYYELKSNYKITNCDFESIQICLFSSYMGTGNIGGDNQTSGNKFEDAEYGVTFYDCSNAITCISNNSFKKMIWGGIQLVQGWLSHPAVISKFLIRNNYIEITKFGDGMTFMDYETKNGFGKKMDIDVTNNQIYLNNTIDGGIDGIYAKDVRVTNNKIWGNGIAGIYSQTWPYDDPQGDNMSGWFIKGNNVQGVNAEVAPIWLTSSSHDNIVIGGSLKTTVLDEGTNNILIGVDKKHKDHPRQEIRDNNMRDHNMMRSFKSHRR